MTLVLASGSATRAALLCAAGVPFTARPAHIDEDALKQGLLDQNMSARDIADALAEAKARKQSLIQPGALVLGADQTLELADGTLLSKAQSPEEAVTFLQRMSGQRHRLHSAAVIAENGEPIWRALESVKLTMRPLGRDYVADYVASHWDDIRHSVGCYQIEAVGAQLMARIDGSHFAILGLPLLPLLGFLRDRGIMAS
ncbi:MAG: nucleoside triphosphate pyrophosphatase [Pseudomonadota bacterium]